jgi:RND family efflux transporter MFP subunit
VNQDKKNQHPEVGQSSVSERPPGQGGNGSKGRYGFIMLVAFLVGVGGWLATRVSSTVQANKAIELDRKARPVVATDVTEVSLAPLGRGRWGAKVAIEGTVEAKDRAELAFKAGGRLAQVNVRVGDMVRAGQILGQLDANEAAAQLRAAEAQLEAARAQAALAADQGERTGKLVASGALAEATGVQAVQGRALAEAQVRAAAAQLSLVKATLSNHALVAPFSGVVTKAPTTRGSVVSPGQALFEVVDNSALRLKGTVNEADAALVAAGASVEVETDRGPAKGKVRVVVQVLDRVTRRVPVEVDLDLHSGLRVGGFVRALISGEREVDVITVPGSSLRPGSQDTVLVVEGDRLAEKQIRFAVEPNTGTLLVRSGLRGDEKVVLAPRPEAKSGDLVKVIPSAPVDAAAPKQASVAEKSKKE